MDGVHSQTARAQAKTLLLFANMQAPHSHSDVLMSPSQQTVCFHYWKASYTRKFLPNRGTSCSQTCPCLLPLPARQGPKPQGPSWCQVPGIAFQALAGQRQAASGAGSGEQQLHHHVLTEISRASVKGPLCSCMLYIPWDSCALRPMLVFNCKLL